MSERILSVLVEDKPGVLARVASTISRRGFNINSLAVGPTNIEGRSKMTIVTELESVEQVKKQLNKLINVIKIVELDPDNTIESEVLLLKVSKHKETRRQKSFLVSQLFQDLICDKQDASYCT